MKRIYFLSLVVFSSMTLCACGFFNIEARYGTEYNEERMKVGVPIIPGTWEIASLNRDECTWVNPERQIEYDSHTPVHWSKYLNYRTGTLLSETDLYFGKEDYDSVEGGILRESLEITYHYREDEYDYRRILGWEVRLQNNEHPTGYEIDLGEAEEILAEWGIERLSYEFFSQ